MSFGMALGFHVSTNAVTGLVIFYIYPHTNYVFHYIFMR
jgi:hypothetical protein